MRSDAPYADRVVRIATPIRNPKRLTGAMTHDRCDLPAEWSPDEVLINVRF